MAAAAGLTACVTPKWAFLAYAGLSFGLSKGAKAEDFRFDLLERPGGIEPPPHPWEGRVPPQHLGRFEVIVASNR